jgi:Peptidase family M28
MFDGRIYRAAFVPLLLVLAIVGFSLASQPAPMGSTLAPDAFDGGRAYTELTALAKRFPDRLPGSRGDDALAGYVAQGLRGSGSPSGSSGSSRQGAAGGGFQVTTHRFNAHTIDGSRTLTTVVAERPGSTGLSPIAILAHRDAVGHGSAAELSGTAALLELARVFAQSETRRTIVLVSTSGASGGDAGAADFVGQLAGPPDATVVLGDMAGAFTRRPFVLPFSSGIGMAPEGLQRTFDTAISHEVGVDAGAPSVGAQFAHFAFPLTTGEETSLNAAGTPAVLIGVGGERGPASSEAVSASRLLNFGRAVLSGIYALDEGPDVAHSASQRLLLGRKTLPGWAIRLLALALLLPPLLVSIDALARLRRRREPLLRWVVWTLAGALPFFTCALFAMLLGRLGVVAAPAGQPPAATLSTDASVYGALASVVLVLALALLAWPALVRRLALPLRPSADGAGLAVMLVLLAVAVVTWVFNPFACLLLVPAVHLWLLPVGVARRPSSRARAGARGVAFFAIFAGALPLVMLLVLYARELGLGPGGLAESAVLVLAGGQVGVLGALLWSTALGCLLAILLLAPPPADSVGTADAEKWAEISTRGPASYAGPGSLGGTESALRR